MMITIVALLSALVALQLGAFCWIYVLFKRFERLEQSLLVLSTSAALAAESAISAKVRYLEHESDLTQLKHTVAWLTGVRYDQHTAEQ